MENKPNQPPKKSWLSRENLPQIFIGVILLVVLVVGARYGLAKTTQTDAINNTIKSQYGALSSQISTLTTNLTTLTNSLATLKTAEDTSIANTQKALQTNIDNVNKTLTALKTQEASDMALLNTTSSGIQTQVTNLTALQTQVTTLSSTVSSLTSQVTALASAVAISNKAIGATTGNYNGISVVFISPTDYVSSVGSTNPVYIQLVVKITNNTGADITNLDIIGYVTLTRSVNYAGGYPTLSDSGNSSYVYNSKYDGSSLLKFEFYKTSDGKTVGLANGASITLRPQVGLLTNKGSEYGATVTGTISISSLSFN